MTTTNLDIDYIDPGVNDKTIKANEAFDDFDGAIAGYDATLWSFTADADLTPTAEDCKRSMSFKIVEGSLASNGKSVIVPATAKLYYVWNGSLNYSVTVKPSGGTGITLLPNERQLLYSDGTNCEVAGDPTIIISGFALDTPTASDICWQYVAPYTIDFNDDWLGAQAYADTAPSGGAVAFDVQINSTSKGSITFADAGQTGTFATSGTTEQLTPGDRLEVHAPSTMYGIKDIAWSFFGVRG